MCEKTEQICEGQGQAAFDVTAVLARIEQRQIASAEAMPTDHAALQVMFAAFDRLRSLGWREAMYCPKDGTVFDSISAGSTGIHPCHYEGDWPKGTYWVHDGGDLWPANPILFRPRAEGRS